MPELSLTGLNYLLISQFLTCLMLVIVFFVVWRTVIREKYVLLWLFGYMGGLVSGFFNAAISNVPDDGWYWSAYSSVFMVIVGILLAGLRMRSGKPPLRYWHVLLLLLFQSGIIWFGHVDKHVGLQMGLVPYAAATFLYLCAFEVRKKTQENHLAEWALLTLMAFYATCLIGSGTVAVLQGRDFEHYYLNLYLQITFLVQPAAFSGIGIFSVLMMADDLATKMRDLATTDQLTDLLNRRGFDRAVQRITSYIKRNDAQLVVVIADLDHFKNINDKYSHHIGDLALQQFAQEAQSILRKEDLFARIGGEEFAILLIGTPLVEAGQIIERLRAKVNETPILLDNGESLTISCSFGMVEYQKRHKDVFSAMRDADTALYQAKESGRNKIVVFEAV